MKPWYLIAVPLACLMLDSAPVKAGDSPDQGITLTIKDHRFDRENIRIPANQPSAIVIRNEDDTAEEFESSDLKIEKIVGGERQITVHVPPMQAGAYRFIGEYHQDTAHGTITAE